MDAVQEKGRDTRREDFFRKKLDYASAPMSAAVLDYPCCSATGCSGIRVGRKD
jgi:hypothetical protein